MSTDDALDALWGRAGLGSERCLGCDVCCRFASPTAAFVPFFTAAEAAACGLAPTSWTPEPEARNPEPGVRPLVVREGEWWRCPLRAEGSQACTAYGRRPLDCRLYPFVLAFDRLGKGVWLGLDSACPFAAEAWGSPRLAEAADAATRLLEGVLADGVAAAPGIVGGWQEHVRLLRLLPGLSRRICRSDLGLARLVGSCRGELGGLFARRPTALSGHAFPAIYLWGSLFNLFWRVEADCLLVFAESEGVSFLIAPPLGGGDAGRALRAAGETMAAINGPRGGARVQEVDAGLLPALAAEGWEVGHRTQEYVCETASLVELRGRHFDGRRHDVRRFEALCPGAVWRRYAAGDFPACAALLQRWQAERAAAHPDPLYRGQLEAAGHLHLRTLREAEELGLEGYVVELPPAGADGWRDEAVGGAEDPSVLPHSSTHPRIQPSSRPIAAYTFGFPLADGATFADFIEVADLRYRGLAAWTFRRLCREARDWPWLNLGTDSELPSLARAKLACRPARIVASYVLNSPQ